MEQKLKILFLVCVDLTIIVFAPYLSLYLRLEENLISPYYDNLLAVLPILIASRFSVFFLMGLYNRLWRYASINEVLTIFYSVTLSSIIFGVYTLLFAVNLPRSIHLLAWTFTILLIGFSRLCVRFFHYWHKMEKCPMSASNVLIVGAGDAGAMIARELGQRYYDSKKLIGFVDDAPQKQSQMLYGAKVLGTRREIKQIAADYQVSEIIVAMPSSNGSVIREILRDCKETQCNVKMLPGMYELIDGKVTVQQLRNVALEDLLRRDPIQLDLQKIATYLTGKRILITGAGGSIGSELCRQVAKLSPDVLYLLGKGENSIYEIELELREKFPGIAVEPIIADIRDQSRINDVFHKIKPHVVFHAAAHKHVPLMEKHPVEAVRNNIFGTKIVVEASDRAGVETFIMISTDKAVNPTSVMGATKRVAELIVQNMNKVSNTRCAAVRFGNVLGSRGSVVPLFRKQIARGGPVTITHPEMIRYFMTIPEAVQLVLQAGALTRGGEVFVLDMGEPVKIYDMACELIELSGLVPHKDIEIKFTGLRPGEKLYEELLTAEEGTSTTNHEKIFIANLKETDEIKLQKVLLELQGTSETSKIIDVLQRTIPNFRKASNFSEMNIQYSSANEKVDPDFFYTKHALDAR